MSDRDKYNYKDDVSIDYSNLLASELDQSVRYWKYAKLHANAIADRERMKDQIDILKSEIDLEIRENPDDYTDTREASILAMVKSDERYKDKIKEYYELNEDVYVFAAAMRSMEQRSYMITNINDTLKHGIFSVPRTMIEQAEARKKAKDSMEDEHRKHMNKGDE